MTIDELFILKIIILIGISIYLIKNKSKKYKSYVFVYLLGIFISFIYRQNFIFSNIGVVVISKDNYFILQTLTGRYISFIDHQFFSLQSPSRNLPLTYI